MTLPNHNELRRELARRTSNKAAVLELLRKRREAGATNVELVEIGGMRAVGARLTELRAEGHDIETIREGGGLFRFRIHEPARVQPGQPGYLASLPVAEINGGYVFPPKHLDPSTGLPPDRKPNNKPDAVPAPEGRLF